MRGRLSSGVDTLRVWLTGELLVEKNTSIIETIGIGYRTSMLALSEPAAFDTCVTTLRIEPVLSEPATMLVTGSLVIGTTGVVVVDAGFTLDQGAAIADRVEATGLPLRSVVITHEHPDHYLGASSLLERWPDAPLLAAPEVVTRIAATGEAKLAQWRPVLGDRLPQSPPTPRALDQPVVLLDGERIEVLSLGQGDCADNTAIHVPSASAVIAGDFAYSGTHVWLVETDLSSRRDWQANLDRLIDLGATTVIAGHIAPGSSTGPDVLVDTRAYLDTFDLALDASGDEAELIARMSERYPKRLLPLILQLSAQAAFGSEL